MPKLRDALVRINLRIPELLVHQLFQVALRQVTSSPGHVSKTFFKLHRVQGKTFQAYRAPSGTGTIDSR